MSRTTRARLAVLIVALAAGALPTSASAASFISFNRDEVLVIGRGEERSIVTVREVAGALLVSDTAGLTHSPTSDFRSRCAPVDGPAMRCPRRRVELRLGNGDDVAGPMNTGVAVEINGQEGDDTYNAGNPSFLTNVEFVGGSDADTATYANSGGSGGGRGVQITNDGQPNDGRRGLDTDNIGRDVEELVGSNFADEITANGPRDFAVLGEFRRTSVRGGQGDDVLRVGADGNLGVRIMNGAVADGADKIISGPAFSTIDYSERVRPVQVTLNFGGADDGDAGERDEIIGRHEVLVGSPFGDTLRAPATSTEPHAIDGGGGPDTIEGGNGPDSLTGGPDRDTIRGFGGDDRVSAKDGRLDDVDCGLGSDSFDLDTIDSSRSCENGTIGVLRLAPKALRARAGETALLKLTWRHPRSWRQLRRVSLRLYRGQARVGEVAISPRSGRIGDRGAVTVARRSTRLTHKGKTVSARLALRLGRRLAGRGLRVEVAAVDLGGARQVEPLAGSIRVAK